MTSKGPFRPKTFYDSMITVTIYRGLLWLNPGWQLSATELLAHSPDLWDGGEN